MHIIDPGYMSRQITQKPLWQKAKKIGSSQEVWVPNRRPDHEEYYETNEGDWIHQDYIELLPDFSDDISTDKRLP